MGKLFSVQREIAVLIRIMWLKEWQMLKRVLAIRSCVEMASSRSSCVLCLPIRHRFILVLEP